MRLLGLEDPRWLDFVQSRPDASLFHHPAWARLLADCYGFPAHAVVLEADGGGVRAGLPVMDVSRPLGGRRWVSLPFTDSCPVLGDARSGDLVSGLVELARSRRLAALELRTSLPEDSSVQSSAAFVRHELPLPAGGAAGWEHLSTNHRRNVRSAERAGVRISRGTSAQEMEAFYRLHVATRRRLGVPIQPRRFFALLVERVMQRGLGFVMTAHVSDVPVAAAIFGSWNGTLIYKYGARDERFAKLGANHLLMWTAIRSASDDGCRVFDLGRSDPGQTQLRRFKDGWGAEETALSYSWVARAQVRNPSHRLEQVMSVLIRNSSPWVCRAVGELFYRYAA
jgi:CelD/BcsL family acetyltransferase involved in cellulose biosynthesis